MEFRDVCRPTRLHLFSAQHGPPLPDLQGLHSQMAKVGSAGINRQAKARRHTASVHASEESDHVIVPRNPLNKDGHPSAERGEGSAWTKENARLSRMHPTQ